MTLTAEQIIISLSTLLFFACLGWWLSHRNNNQNIALIHAQKEQEIVLQEKLKQAIEQLETLNHTLITLRQQSDTAHTGLASATQRITDQQQTISKLEQQIQAEHSQLAQLRNDHSSLKTTLAQLQTLHEKTEESYQEKLALLDAAKTTLSNEFQIVANKIFDAKSMQMRASSKETLDAVLKPMQQDIVNFRHRIEQVHEADTIARSSLERHLDTLKQLNQQMSQDAIKLTHALKGDSKTQGNWGEMILEKLLESSGLREGKEFAREQSFTNDEGKRQRPDVIIYMPGDKHVIIDAKVSLTDYERAINSDVESQRSHALQAHVKSMQQHILTLANKRYDHLEGIHSPDYVLMFVPIEGAYMMAIEANPAIFEMAFEKRIAVVTPSTLYATLKLIEQLWRYERQTENVAKLIKQAGALHDKFVGFLTSFEDINKHLDGATNAYATAMNQLKTGKGNLINRAQALADLSGKAKKEIPSHLREDLHEDSHEHGREQANHTQPLEEYS